MTSYTHSPFIAYVRRQVVSWRNLKVIQGDSYVYSRTNETARCSRSFRHQTWRVKRKCVRRYIFTTFNNNNGRQTYRLFNAIIDTQFWEEMFERRFETARVGVILPDRTK